MASETREPVMGGPGFVLSERLRERLIAGVVTVDPLFKEQLVNRGADHNARGATFGRGVVSEQHSHEGCGANHGDLA